MTDKTRALIVFLAAAVGFMLLFSAFYIAIEADHDCIGEECLICSQICICENTLRSAFQTAAVIVLAAFAAVFVVVLPSFAKKPVHNTSLVALKVKLSD